VITIIGSVGIVSAVRAAVIVAWAADAEPTGANIHIDLCQSRRRGGSNKRACGDKTKCEFSWAGVLAAAALRERLSGRTF
jgi:hypothetical protein